MNSWVSCVLIEHVPLMGSGLNIVEFPPTPGRELEHIGRRAQGGQ